MNNNSSNNDNIQPAIILVSPQMGENIGAAARAMQNFSLSDLRLVNPRDGWPNDRAISTASGALEHMPEVKTFSSFSEAISDLNFVFATTSRSRDMVKPVFSPIQAAIESKRRVLQKQKIGFVFGAERTGLVNDDLAQCQAILSIKTNPEFHSINLAQSVLLMAYEYFRVSIITSAQPERNTDDSPAKQEDIHIFMNRLQRDLEKQNFFRSEDLKPTMLRNIQNIFTRADITDQELRTLHGILSALRGNKKSQ